MRNFTLNIIKDYYGEGQLFGYDEVELVPGVTILVGCNGSGKTTLLRQIEHRCEEADIPVIRIDNLRQGGHTSMGEALMRGDLSFVAQQAISSEGENIVNNMSNWANKIGAFVNRHNDSDTFFILMDAIDSGLSVDNIIEIKEDFFKFVISVEEEKNHDIYFVVAANSYEMCRNEDCIDVVNGKHIKFENYEQYRRYIVNTRKHKNARYGWDAFNHA